MLNQVTLYELIVLFILRQRYPSSVNLSQSKQDYELEQDSEGGAANTDRIGLKILPDGIFQLSELHEVHVIIKKRSGLKVPQLDIDCCQKVAGNGFTLLTVASCRFPYTLM